MRSLLYKDFMNLKQQLRLYVIIIVFYAFIGLKQQNMSMLGGVMALFAVMLSVTAYAYDERSGWDKYALTMPFSIRDLILSKYLLSLIGVCVTTALAAVLNLVSGISVKETLVMTAAFTTLGLFTMEIILPVIFRFGVEKGRVLMILIFLLPTIITLSVFNHIPADTAEILIERAIYMAPFVCVALLPVSVAASFRGYKKKQL